MPHYVFSVTINRLNDTKKKQTDTRCTLFLLYSTMGVTSIMVSKL